MQLNATIRFSEKGEWDLVQKDEPECHPFYEVMCENGKPVGTDILQLYYGETWEPILDRLTHRFDGYLMKIHHQGYCYKVYRKLQDHTPQLYSFVTP